MADGIVANTGSGGDTIAADDVGGAKYQRNKLNAGNNNSVDADASRSNPFPMAAYANTSGVHDGTVTLLTPKFAVIDDALSPDNTIVAAVASRKLRVLAWKIVATGTVIARWESDTGGTALTGQMPLAAQTVVGGEYCPLGHFETVSGELLNLELSTTVSVDGWLVYVEVP